MDIIEKKKYSSWQDADPFLPMGQDQLKLMSLLCTLEIISTDNLLTENVIYTENCDILKLHVSSLLTFAENESSISLYFKFFLRS